MSKQKKYTLTFDDEIDFDVFGISSPFADYRLAWELNGILKIQLEKQTESIIVFDKKSKKNNSFQLYSFFDEENLTRFYLIRNKQQNCLIASENQIMDYFLVIKENLTLDLANFLTDLRKINGIVAVFKLESEKFDFVEQLA
jgi:hypothetical protein